MNQASEPFVFPARPIDRLTRLLGLVERRGRGVLRRLGEDPRRIVEDLWKLRRFPPAAPLASALLEIKSSPVLYFPAVAWGYRFQRPQQLARALCGLGRPLVYVEAFQRQRLQPPFFASQLAAGPLVLQLRVAGRPDPYRSTLSNRDATALAEVLAAGVRRRPGFILVQLPFWGTLGEKLRDRLGAPLVYDRLDLYAGFPGVPSHIGDADDALLRSADLVIASSCPLMEAAHKVGATAWHVPNAAAADFTLAAHPPAGRIRIGYVGALAEWFDPEAVRAAACAHPEWLWPLAGEVESEDVRALRRLPNVLLLGEMPHHKVPGFLRSLHALVIPFADRPLTRAADPVKLYEALATGLPVVARRLPATETWQEPFVYLYSAPEEMERQVARAIAQDSPALRQARAARVRSESWTERARQLLAAVETSGAGGC